MYSGRRGQQGVPWTKGDVCNEKWKRNGTRTGRESNINKEEKGIKGGGN